MFASESSHAGSSKNSWICESHKPQPSKKCTTRWKHWDLMMPPLTKRNTTCTANKQNPLWRMSLVSFFCLRLWNQFNAFNSWLFKYLNSLKFRFYAWQCIKATKKKIKLQGFICGKISCQVFSTATKAQRIKVSDGSERGIYHSDAAYCQILSLWSLWCQTNQSCQNEDFTLVRTEMVLNLGSLFPLFSYTFFVTIVVIHNK